MAHMMAMESALITADVIEVTEFPHLGQRYQVMGVPKTVFNDTVSVEGAVPESQFLAKLLNA
jgi:predicted DsbA family dithiol-disulfide isomerase